jgi:hypothetical protein
LSPVKKNPLNRIFSTEFVEKKRGFPHTKFVYGKGVFNIYIPTNSLKIKQLALITERFCPYMVPLLDAVKAEIDGGDTGKRDYRQRSRTGRVDNGVF